MTAFYIPEVYAVIVYAGVVALVASVILRSGKMAVAEMAVLAGLMFWFNGLLLIIGGIVQLAISVFLFGRLITAVNRNYRLVLEKTHRIPRVMTERGADGAQSSFL
ncbi:hypothetical protein [Thalassobacillus devorans]|uniref:hypothetical protein n=1 Tax=Thalassobacillus devorans TaxID=279813 RepID=UPI000A1C8B4F|nr:hypothetical protein [Thalassobacillus devorans]